MFPPSAKIKSALIPLASLHITFMVMFLEDDQQIKKACGALDAVKVNMLKSALWNSEIMGAGDAQEIFRNPSYTLQGLNIFQNGVLFASVDKGKKELTEIDSIIRRTFEEHEIPSTDSKPFNPHATLLKLWKGKGLKKQGIKNIDPTWYDGVKDTHFGEVSINGLQLCSMLKPKDPETKFYHIEHSIQFE